MGPFEGYAGLPKISDYSIIGGRLLICQKLGAFRNQRTVSLPKSPEDGYYILRPTTTPNGYWL